MINSPAGVQFFGSHGLCSRARRAADAASGHKVPAKDVPPMSDPARTWLIRTKFSLVINKSMALIELDFFFLFFLTVILLIFLL